MGTKIKRFFKKIRIKRTTILVLVFVFMSATLVRQLFELQIIQGQDYISKFESRTTKKRVIKSTRGNIYDRNGEELATNVLAYSVTFEDNGTYDSTREKNLTLNGIAYKVLKILESNGDSISTGFHIVLDESGNYAFDVDEGFTLNRFRADIYGEPLIDNLTKKQKNATADQMIEFMSGKEGFSIVLYGDNAYTKEELTSHGLPENLSKQDILELSKIRYALSTNSFKKYMAVTIASNISEKSVAAIREDQPELQGIDIVEDSVRKYINDASMGPILGYTGQASSEELEELRQKNPDYSNDAIIGKSGIEKYMETSLQGTDGEETVTVDNLGKVLKIDDSTRVEPVAGNDTYLTIDSSWQSAIYQILKQRVAGILLSKIEASKTYDFSVNDAAQIKIPIYDVYNALIANSVIDISKFSDANASDTEKNLYAKFQQKQQQVFDTISNRLTGDNPPAYKDEDTQMQEVVRECATGIESIEFSIAENLDRLEEKISSYRERLWRMGWPHLSLHGPFLDLNPMTYDSLILEATKKRYEQVYEAGRRLEAEKIVFHTCHLPDAYLLIGWAERVADFFKRFLDGKDGIMIVMENVFDRIPEPMVEVVERVDRPDFRLCLDIGHAHCYSDISVLDWAKSFGSYVSHVHVHDNMGDRDSHIALGEGTIPYEEVLGLLKQNNPQMDCTIECSSLEKVKKSYACLKQLKENGIL